jgi:hypothetical protein
MPLKLSILCLLFLFIGSSAAKADPVLPWATPTSNPLNSRIEEGWNWLMVGGAHHGHGKSRQNFVDTTPWERGWLSAFPWAELGMAYAPNTKWEVGLQVPLTVISSTVNVYYGLNDSVKLGAKLGLLQTFSVTLSHFTEDRFFFTVSPNVGLNWFGFPPSRDVNVSELLEPLRIEELNQSRYFVGGQLSVGRQIDPVDLALFVSYNFAPGAGIDNSFIFDDTLLKHFVKAGLTVSF